MALTLINYIPSLTPLLVSKSPAAIVSKISIVLAFSHVKVYVSKIDIAIKGQGHPMVIILANCDGLESSMLHTKFVEIGPTVLEKSFEGFLPYIGVVAILVM